MRQAEICEFITNRGEASVEVLAARFATSAETIRRDLGLLANAGLLRKVHGGAKAISAEQEGAFGVRMRRNSRAKKLIAERLAKLVKPGMTLFLDTGSTTLFCAQALARVKRLTVITNATRVAAALAEGSGGAEIYLLGGRYRGDNAQTVGVTALGEIDMYQADMAVLTVGAVDETGVSDFSNHESQVARAMIRASASLTVVADHTKFGRRAPFKVSNLDGIERIVANQAPGAALQQALTRAGVTLCV
jgi:DeoR family glycerol-3-phosphate regulon repressor